MVQSSPVPLAHAILLTGVPGVGKTTVIRRIADALVGRRIRGFTTEDIREGGQRLGFRLTTFDRQFAVLAHVDVRSRQRVGRYGVDIGALEKAVDLALALDERTDVYLIDEIGKMECLSSKFVTAMTKLLDSSHLIVSTIAARGSGLIEQAKRRPDVELWEVTRENRNEVPERVVSRLLNPQPRTRFLPAPG